MDTLSTSAIFEIALAPDFTTSRLLFAVRQNGLQVSKDGGKLWQKLFQDMPFPSDMPASAIALSPNFSSDGTMFVGVNGAIIYSSEHGASWRVSSLGLPAPTVTTIKVSPNFQNDRTVYVGTLEDGVFRSIDGGQSFERSNFHLYDYNINCLRLSPNYQYDKSLFVGTNIGGFYSRNAGQLWQSLDFQLKVEPIVSILVLATAAGKLQFFIGTEHSGVFTGFDGDHRGAYISVTRDLKNVNAIEKYGNAFILLADGELFMLEPCQSDYRLSKICADKFVTSFAISNNKILVGSLNGKISTIQL